MAQSTYSSEYFVGLTARRCALIASYEALLRYPVHPFSIQSLSTGPKAHSTRTGRGPAREKTIASRRSP